jgi:hypothetical protein
MLPEFRATAGVRSAVSRAGLREVASSLGTSFHVPPFSTRAQSRTNVATADTSSATSIGFGTWAE